MITVVSIGTLLENQINILEAMKSDQRCTTGMLTAKQLYIEDIKKLQKYYGDSKQVKLVGDKIIPIFRN